MMRQRMLLTAAALALLTGCIKKGPNPDDPYESINRKTHQFNQTYDKIILKPLAKIYVAILPQLVRTGIDNAYNNIATLPTIANDILQAQFKQALKDTWRFGINTTLGIGGVYDAASHCGLPMHTTDLGVTFAKWGDMNSPYMVIPFMGPSTFRDAVGMTFDYALFTPYPYIPNDKVIYGLLGLRYVDLRSQMLDNDSVLSQALDEYSLIRDAYLQHRKYMITGEQVESGDLYVDSEDEEDEELLEETSDGGENNLTPITTAGNVTHRPLSTRDTA